MALTEHEAAQLAKVTDGIEQLRLGQTKIDAKLELLVEIREDLYGVGGESGGLKARIQSIESRCASRCPGGVLGWFASVLDKVVTGLVLGLIAWLLGVWKHLP